MARQDFPGRVGGWVVGWVRNTENKTQLRPALAGALPLAWKDFPGRVVGGWVVRNTENKTQLRLALAGALPELGKKKMTYEVKGGLC